MKHTREKNELREYEMWLYQNEKSGATANKYVAAVRRFQEYLEGRAPTHALLLAYRERMSKEKKPQTVNGQLSAIHSWLRFLGKEESCVRFLKVQRAAFLDESRKLDRDEYERLLRTARETGQERLYMVMLTLGGTGIRIGELRYITVEAARSGCARIRLKGKCREVPLTGRLCGLLLEYARRMKIAGGIIFRTRSGAPLDRSNICHAMKRLCGAAQVDERKVFPHSFRHLFARAFYEIGKDLAKLADVLGHSHLETTRIYVADSFRAFEEILERTGLLPGRAELWFGKTKYHRMVLLWYAVSDYGTSVLRRF